MLPLSDPWKPFDFSDEPEGSLVAFLSDDSCKLPVRHVTRVGDNKADPNLETGTYGLFTTCYRRSRSGTVRNQRKWLFFTTKHAYSGESVIPGYYALSHYAAHPGRERDFALQAEDIHFIEKPLITQEVYDELDFTSSPIVRGSKTLSFEQSEWLKEKLNEQPNATDQYIAEIDRLERLNKSHTGFRHIGLGMTEPFSWDAAQKFLKDPHPECVEETPPRSGQSGIWTCQSCGETVKNVACLRVCKHCGEVHTLAVCNESTDTSSDDNNGEEQKSPSLFSS